MALQNVHSTGYRGDWPTVHQTGQNIGKVVAGIWIPVGIVLLYAMGLSPGPILVVILAVVILILMLSGCLASALTTFAER